MEKDFQIMEMKVFLYFFFPFAGGHARDNLEISEKRHLGAEARFRSHGGSFHVRLLAKQFLCMADAVGVDKLGERLSATVVDTFADVAAVGAKIHRHILKLQVAAKVKLLLGHELTDTV